MIKFETLGMNDIAKINPVLTSESDVDNYSFVEQDDIVYLVAQAGLGDNARAEYFTIPAGEYLRGYDLSPFVDQKFVIDLIHTDLDYNDADKKPAKGVILVIDNGSLKKSADIPESGFYFEITDIGEILTGAAVKARLGYIGANGEPAPSGIGDVEQFLITFSVEEDQQNEGEYTATADKTYAQVSAAYDAGALLVASVEQDGDEIARLGLSGAYYTGSGYDFVFESVVYKYEFRVGIGEDGAYYEDTAGSAQPSGGGAFVVTMELDAQTESIVGNKTYAEVYEAYTEGQRVLFAFDDETLGMSLYFDLASAMLQDRAYAFDMLINGEAMTSGCEATSASEYFSISMG